MHKKQTILILIGHYLPGYKSGGPQTSILNLVENLSDTYNFKIITLDRDFGDTEPFPNIELNKWVKVGKGEVLYIKTRLLFAWEMIAKTKQTDYDILYLNPLFAPYSFLSVIATRLGYLNGKNVIVAPRGELFDEALSIKPFKKKVFLWVAKKLGLYSKVIWHATTEHERDFIEKVMSADASKIRTAQIMTHIGNPSLNEQKPNDDHRKYDIRIVYLARIAQDKNVLFTFDVLQQVKVKVLFDMYGPIQDQTLWQNCLDKIKKLPPNITVNYHGSKERNEVKTILSSYDLFFLPTFAENFGHSIAESLLVGTPVLISDNTPWRNLQADGLGWDINLQASELFVQAIESLANLLPTERQAQRTKVKDTIQKRLADPAILNANKALFHLPF